MSDGIQGSGATRSEENTTSVGPSRIVRWTMPDGTRHEQTYDSNPRVSCVAEWKVIMLGAVEAECLDLAGHVTHRFTKQDADGIARQVRP